MNEFIIWDMIINKPVVVATIEDYISVNFKDRCKSFIDIRLKDINGKNIYADNSIVEFDKYSCGHSEQLKGFFRESSPMIFQIVILDNDIWNVLYWHEFRHSIKNIKIIDTIQENKLGLIK